MDEDGGDLLYYVNGISSRLDKGGCSDLRVDGVTLGKPTIRDLEVMLYVSMAKPKEGRPRRPSQILFAHRFVKEVTDGLVEKLLDKLNIVAKLETQEQAEKSALVQGVRADGYNWSVGKYVNELKSSEYTL